MKLELQMRLQQTLAPQLIQSLKMLQMPILHLEQVLRQELAINPLLEEMDYDEEEEAPSTDEEEVDPNLNKIDWNEYLGDDHEFRVKPQREESEDRLERVSVLEKTLYDHLIEQLSFSKLTLEEYEIGEYIIGNIDDSGYLSCSLEEIVDSLKSDPALTEKVLRIIQAFDPTGVGARNLRESLLIQLRERGLEGSLAYRIVDEHLSDLDKKSHSQLAKSLGVSFEEVQEAMDLIRTLSPKPTMGRFSPAATPVIPDLIVERVADGYVVFHNDRNSPRLRINPIYKELIRKQSTSSPEEKKYVKEKLEQARWFLNAINQRRSTMIRTMETVVEEQKDFFEHGMSHLKPLTMQAVAEKLGMNVATISRVANDKYVQTPQGVFEIRYFFNTGVQKQDGEELSRLNVKQMLEEIIKKEDPLQPLSDQEIYTRLKEKGLNIARRTVTKYREELKILPARFRKRMVKEKIEDPASSEPEEQ
jgi:RNA polymerase sigma-54 factor